MTTALTPPSLVPRGEGSGYETRLRHDTRLLNIAQCQSDRLHMRTMYLVAIMLA